MKIYHAHGFVVRNNFPAEGEEVWKSDSSFCKVFGGDVQISDTGDGNFKFSLMASPRAMRFWILQFGRYVKVLSPQTLVDKIKEDIACMGALY